MSHLLSACRSAVAALLAALAAAAAAQAPAPSELSLDSLRRGSRISWSQAQRDVAFAQWDRLYPSRVVARGAQAKPLPEGAPLPTFAAGGAGAAQLQRSIDEFQLAGIVVLHDSKVRLERYARGHGAAGRWVSFSIAKSLTSPLMGAAIRDGAIAGVDDLVTRYIPELRDSAYDGVTLRHLLTMSTGAKWNEDYGDPGADVALFFSMPVDPGLDATVSYMRKLPRDAAPGTRWHYNTGETNLIGAVVERATKKELAAYASEKIWARYGMEQDAAWTLDRSGHVQAGCCLQASTRDFARFGQFILDGARVDGAPTVADGWLEAATREQADIGAPGRGYGYQWWTADNGTFSAIGIHGQQVLVDPRRRLIVAINSAWPIANFTRESVAARQALIGAIRSAIDGEGVGSAGR
jgi:CubicO group peptidase (beta-lactamase class C family)